MAIPNDPNTREEHYLASMAGQKVDLPQPIPRIEKYLAKAAGMDVETPDPLTRVERYLDVIAESGGGGGSSVTVEPLTVTENGTTTAPSGTAYSPVTVNVPNSYGAADEGKVVNNGALVAQTAHAPVTANGTIDTTLNNSVPVNVPNPNYVETISGTVTDPWGTMTTEEIVSLIDAVIENAATIKVSFQRGGKNYAACATQYVDPTTGDTYDGVRFNFLFDDSSSFAFASIYAAYVDGTLYKDGDDGVVSTSFGGVSRQNLQQWAQTAGPTTMTIIHHPLPDSE